MPDKPFFVYFAPGATHAPHHVPPEWSAKYKGRFDQGWDALREETFARQKELGVIPPEAELTARPEEIPAWDDMPDDLKPVLARQMEVYAGFLEHTDHHVGRLVDALEDLGDPRRHARLLHHRRQRRERRGHAPRLLQRAGRPQRRVRRSRRPSSWCRGSTTSARRRRTTTTPSAGRTRWTRRTSGRSRSRRTGAARATARSCTGRAAFEAQGEVRSQFHHVIDVAPTVLEAAGLPEPTTVHGVEQRPIEGVSMRYAFDDAGAAERRETQYFEMFCNRGIYHEGWTAVTRHSTPWVVGRAAAVRRRHLGALRHEHGLEPGARPRGRDAREARGAQGAVHGRGAQVQRPPARRPARRALQLRHRRAAGADHGQLAAALRRAWDG